jgi:hypothetical protein
LDDTEESSADVDEDYLKQRQEELEASQISRMVTYSSAEAQDEFAGFNR